MLRGVLAVALVAAAAAAAVMVGAEPIAPPSIEDWGNTAEACAAADDDTVEVYYIEYPLFEAKYGDLLGHFNLFHGAVGFINQNTGVQCMAEYAAWPEFIDAVIPQVQDLNSTAGALTWDNYASVFPLDYIRNTTANVTLMAEVTGTMHNKLWTWFPTYNATHPYYDLYNILDANDGSTLVPANTCDEFVWATLSELISYGADVYTYKDPKHTFVQLYTQKADLATVDDYATNTTARKVVNGFYIAFTDLLNELATKKNLTSIITDFIDLRKDRTFFVYDATAAAQTYYQLDLYSPFVAIAYHTAPFDEVMAVISRARAAGARLPTVAEVLATLPTATRRYHR